MLYAIVALLVIVLDQWSKLWVASNISESNPVIALLPNLVHLTSVENKGGAFNFLAESNATVLFLIAAGAVALLTIILLATNLVKGGLGRWSLVFITAGGLSNAIDRLMNQGKVLDIISLEFLKNVRLFGLNGINFPIFNVADIFITVFTILLICYIIFGGNKKAAARYAGEEDDEEEDEEEDRPLRRREKKQAPAPEKKPRKAEPEPKPAKNRQSGYEEDYERFKARKAREAQELPAQPKAEPVVNPKDPFAEWDRANRDAEEATAAAFPQARPAAKPAQEAPKPQPKPAPVQEAPKAEPKTEEFSLEDILAEFR